MEKFKSQGGTSVKEFCPYGTRDECRRNNTEKERCTKVWTKSTLISLNSPTFLAFPIYFLAIVFFSFLILTGRY